MQVWQTQRVFSRVYAVGEGEQGGAGGVLARLARLLGGGVVDSWLRAERERKTCPGLVAGEGGAGSFSHL